MLVVNGDFISNNLISFIVRVFTKSVRVLLRWRSKNFERIRGILL